MADFSSEIQIDLDVENQGSSESISDETVAEAATGDDAEEIENEASNKDRQGQDSMNSMESNLKYKFNLPGNKGKISSPPGLEINDRKRPKFRDVKDKVHTQSQVPSALSELKPDVKHWGYFFVANLLPGLVAVTVLVVFLFATVVEVRKEDSDPLNLEFRALAFLILPLSAAVLLLSGFMFCGCRYMERGCCLADHEDNVYQPSSKKYFFMSMRGLELADLLSDGASVVLIYNDFNAVWKTILVTSILLTSLLNLYNYVVLIKDDSWQGRKRRIAVSFAMMAVEDLIIVPVSFLYLFEAANEDTDSTFGFKVEIIAVGLSLAVGILLVILRTSFALHQFSCAKPLGKGHANEEQVSSI